MSIIRVAKRTSWTVVDNRVISDDRLSFAALGLLLYLLSKPDSWTIKVDSLGAERGLGRHAMRTITGELRAAGYLELVPSRDAETGRVVGREYLVHEVPQTPTASSNDADPIAGEPTEGPVIRPSGYPTVGKPAPIVSTEELPSTEELEGVSQETVVGGDANRPRRRPPSSKLGPGSQIIREETHRTPSLTVRPKIEAVYEQVGEDRLRWAAEQWILHGWNPQNVGGILDVARRGTLRHERPAQNPRLRDMVFQPDGKVLVKLGAR